MRIGINALALTAGRPGGDATYVYELIRHLSALAPDDTWVVFVHPHARAMLPEPPAQLKYVVCPVVGSSLPVRVLSEQLLLPALIKRERLDVFHAPVNVAPLAHTTPTVLTLLEAEPFMPSTRMPAALRSWWKVARASSAKRATAVITISQAAKREVQRWMGLPASRICVVPLGVDRTRFNAARTRQSPCLSPFLLWIGRPYPRKNLPRLVRAFATFRAMGRPEVLRLAGVRGWAEPELSAAIQKAACQHAVLREGPIPSQQLPHAYRTASAFVFPSLHEAFGLPVLEALASGTPVIAADIPALREVAGSAASYVNPLDEDQIAAHLYETVGNPRLREQARVDGPRRAALFDWSDTARQTYDIYQQTTA